MSEVPTFAAAPPERIDLPGGAALARCRVARAERAVQAINASLDHLRPWMAWADEPSTVEKVTTFFTESEGSWDARRDFGYSIVDQDDTAILGGCGLHGRLGPDGLEIGYWVHVDHVGRGLATAASRALTDAAFAIPGIQRVRIQCEDGNVASARVPAKLGYVLQGVTVPEDGPCRGRPTQIWLVERSAWMAEHPLVAS
ncbi:MAG: GNAT family N-acetyltransferase [Acidimicrobiia bacterium]|jgi:RimJ/RimL family protein N-acetyltransferase